MTLDDVYAVVRTMESLHPDWMYKTADGSLNTEPIKVFFFKETEDGLLWGSILASDSMATLDLRLYLGCTMKDVTSDPDDFRFDLYVDSRHSPVTLAAASFYQRKGVFGSKIPAEVTYLKKCMDHIATPLISAARRPAAEESDKQQSKLKAMEEHLRRKYIGHS